MASQALVDEAITISVALEGAIQYETVFGSTPYERGRMRAMIEMRNEAMAKVNRK